ncbi:MAG TPA: alpha/beta fold hydrolase [Thermoleophilaceae bacterium]|nr:alpha/beta fold hydrolase [Thermoleophilaceae bacterium]
MSLGVLLVHGFGGSPASMEPWAAHLAARGHETVVPRLPGHGTRWEDLAEVRWPDWYEAASAGLDELRARSDTVAVAGLSMGGALALRLAAERPADVASVVLVNPAVASSNRLMALAPLLQHVIGSVGNDRTMVKKPGVPRASYERLPLRAVTTLRRLWADVRPRLGEVRQPLLLFRSVSDGDLSSRLILEGVSSADTREVLLRDSYHLATLDNDAPRIFAESAEWLESRVGLPAAERLP